MRARQPGTPADEADVQVARVASPTCASSSDLSDYTGELQLDAAGADHRPSQRPIADRAGHRAGRLFPVTVPCAATAGTWARPARVTTTFDAVTPGAVPEGKRAIWELDALEVTDGGADGLAATAPNALFERQGIFVP